MSTGAALWGDPPATDDEAELSAWVADALGPEQPVLTLLADVAAGHLGLGPVYALCRELTEDDADPLDPWLLGQGLIIAGHPRTAHGLLRRLGLITKRGKRVR
ncbi:hypothetical protein GII33_13900 [Gordonia pseudamarae]|uniref:Uncharacterized protein n=1 Tax=Gordonia pseudamarae TaxID=2831662 RepID=A0ABX6IKF3_9ACTN|nr:MULTISPECIES: hypothetical protein [Gordonia]MBD0022549.1 hypothetical protein [Gordonia sp. (in: high G+C Gram-positive bacteria)]QHN26880.1 hypothetical protein GII33_13900 [Gordonia pseudamarae]QHN35770.1 hypothetical protein GII31_13725 [Gordonia pseudamarae]